MRFKKADEGEKERKKKKPKSLEEHGKMSAAKGT
jgi:hypothetical protein